MWTVQRVSSYTSACCAMAADEPAPPPRNAGVDAPLRPRHPPDYWLNRYRQLLAALPREVHVSIPVSVWRINATQDTAQDAPRR